MRRSNITFGTSGWRGIISDDFTFDNVRLVSQAIADYIKEEPQERECSVVVGYDPRFLSEKFAAASSEVLAANGIKVHYSEIDAPTPGISHYIIENSLSGGVNITASHNPPEYSGIKFSPAWGGPALPDTTKKIEENCRRLEHNPEGIKRAFFDDAVENGMIQVVDLAVPYIKKIKELIDTKLIGKSLSCVYDAMYGAGRSYLSKIIENNSMRILNGQRDVLFGGHRPEPAEEYLEDMRNILLGGGYDIGLSTDGDADRFGIMDSNGVFITPNQVMGLALYHLYRKGYRGVAARSVMTSAFMDAVAAELGVEVVETPVGFKYIGDIFVKKDMIVGGEESGGLTIGGHIPEKDGILACLLMAELRATEGKPLSEILDELYKKVGSFITLRKNYRLTGGLMNKIKEKLDKSLPEAFGAFAVKSVNRIDGYKFIMEEKDTWLGVRFSGTEPVIRIYLESTTPENNEALLRSAEEYFGI
ncbi:MAG: phosphoglucomutase/phosphomannomutase family protein [Elusimicrobiota bacterium]